jgi:glycosyltransferase involved in cell wall biosynthesis
VLYLIDSLGMGGAERTLATTVAAIDAEAVDARVCVLQERDGNPLATNIRAMGVPVDMVPVRRLRDLSAPLRLRRYVRRHRIQLIHCHLGFAVSLGGPVGSSLGIPVVATTHTFSPPEQTFRESLREAVYRWSLRNRNAVVIAVSEAGRRHLVEHIPLSADNVRVVYNGVELDRFAPVDPARRRVIRSRHGVGDRVDLITTVSVLRPEKGIGDLIEALPLILRSRPDARLFVVGDGEDRDRLERLTADLGLDRVVQFLGQRDDIPEILAASDLFVLPTLGDMLPTVIAEAMGAGVPVVATDVGSLSEMVQDGVTGLLAAPGAPAELAERCLAVLTDSQRRASFGVCGRYRAEELFDVRAQAAALASLYRELLQVGR